MTRRCGKHLGDNDGTCPELFCVRDRGHEGLCDNTRADPPRPRYFRVEEFSEPSDICGASHWVVAADLRDALEVLAKGDFSDAVRLTVTEMTEAEATVCRTVDDVHDGGRDVLVKWPLGTLLSENY